MPNQPPCPGCGLGLSRLHSQKLRESWAQEEGLKWGWYTQEQAYWKLCLPCHQEAWPGDLRRRGPYCLPLADYWKHLVGGRLRLLAGDFYLTQAPPEYLSHGRWLAPGDPPRRARPAPPLPETVPAVPPALLTPPWPGPAPGCPLPLSLRRSRAHTSHIQIAHAP